jgi:hypothetical protein
LLSVEPLEDRLLLSAFIGPLAVSGGNPNQNTAAAVSQASTQAASDSDTPPGGYAAGQADTTPDAATTDTTWLGATQSANAYTAGGTGATGAAQSSGTSSYASSSGDGHTASTYPTARGGESATEYYPPSSTASAPAAATTAAPAVSAVISTTALAVAAPVLPVLAAPVQAPALIAPPPVQAAAPAPAVTTVGSAEPGTQPPAEGGPKASLSGFQAALAEPSADETFGAALPEVQAGPVFPLSLPLPGGLVALDLENWQRGVRALFQRLEALEEDLGEEAGLYRLAPWCAALGAVTVALELARRRLNKRYPPDLAEIAGRGLTWKWACVPPAGHPPELS